MSINESTWKRIERHDDVVFYLPLDASGRSARVEYMLPSGSALVDDRDSGLAARIDMRERVDWQTFIAMGTELRDVDVNARAAAGDRFVVLRYQDSIDSEGNVTRSILRSVEEYSGRMLVRHEEPDLEVHPPQHLMGKYIFVPQDSDE